jgi:hypothetical protein
VAWVVLALFFVRLAVILRLALRLLAIRPVALWRAVRGGLALAAACALLLAGADRLLGPWRVGAPLSLAAEVALGAAAMIGLLRFVPGLIGADAAFLLRRIADHAPRPVARLLQSLPMPRAGEV